MAKRKRESGAVLPSLRWLALAGRVQAHQYLFIRKRIRDRLAWLSCAVQTRYAHVLELLRKGSLGAGWVPLHDVDWAPDLVLSVDALGFMTEKIQKRVSEGAY